MTTTSRARSNGKFTRPRDRCNHRSSFSDIPGSSSPHAESKRRKIDLDIDMDSISSNGTNRRRSGRAAAPVDYSIKRSSRRSLESGDLSNEPKHVPQEPAGDPIAAKKHQLNEIVDRHDDKVRLLFHLEKFVSLVYYDPKEAKKDNSDVFELYRQRFDLWANSNDGRGRSRHTRRQLQETQHIYEEKKPEESKPVKVKEEKPKKIVKTESRSVRQAHSKASKPRPQPPAPAKPVKKKQIDETSKKDIQKAAKTVVKIPEPDYTWDEIFPYEPQGIVMDIPEPFDSDESDQVESDEPRPRLKFTFTLPKQNVTHPSHVLPDAQHGGSLESCLASFFAIDEEFLTSDERDNYISEQIDVRNRIQQAKENGLLTEDGLTSSEVNEISKFVDPGKVPSHQDHLVSQGIFFSKLMRDERKAHISQARKIAQMIETYFKRLSGAEERERKAEEKAIRQLAKRTALEVMKKWKLAEKVVKQRRLKKIEEEQRAQGKIHLNQILENSAKLLEARIEDQNMLNQEFNSDSDDLSASDIDKSAEEADQSQDSDDSMDSDEMSSDSDDESDEDEGKTNLGDDNLTVEELRAKYAQLDDSDSNEPVELDERAQQIYAEEVGADDSDESIPMDSEDDDMSSDESSAEEGSQSEGEQPSGLAALLSTNHVDEDNDDDDASVDEYEVEEDDDKESKDTPTSSPEQHSSELKIEEDNTHTQIAEKRVHVPSPFLLRGTLREYQHDGLDWLVGLYNNQTNGILADEMGLGKTIQTIALLAHLACENEIWGPHLIVVPTSVMLNWEMEFKRFAPGFKVLTYYGNPVQRKEKRRGWNKENTFHVCITSYQLVLQDQHAFKRKRWHYMILDEAHNIKNFRSQRWQALLNFNSERRLLLTGTPLQNNLVELWSLLYFLMPSSKGNTNMPEGFANLQDFQEWFARPVDRMVEEGGEAADEETRQTVAKLHQVLRPYLLRRLKRDVEKQMPAKYEHIVYCRLSKRQRYLYDDFMSRAQTKETLASGNFLSIINCLMQLRKVCNHPDLFEVRQIVTSLALTLSVPGQQYRELSRFEGMLNQSESTVSLSTLNLLFNQNEDMGSFEAFSTHMMRGNHKLGLQLAELALDGRPVRADFQSIKGHNRYWKYEETYKGAKDLQHKLYLNFFRCAKRPIYGQGLRALVDVCNKRPRSVCDGFDWKHSDALADICKSYTAREVSMRDIINRYSFVTPKALYLDMTDLTLGQSVSHTVRGDLCKEISSCRWDQSLLHDSQVRLSIAFPDKRLLQYDCGKLQRLAVLLRDLTAEGHRALIFTQMTRVLDILEQFLNMHGYRYMRLDGATKVEQRQALTERFNNDDKIPVFILSSRSGGLGINLTGADTVIFYDSDWNPSMDKQCQDRCHRIGQTRDVHVYRFVSEYTIESNILKKATQKQILDNVVIQDGEFTTDYFNKLTVRDMIGDLAENDTSPVANDELDKTVFSADKNIGTRLAQAEDADDAVAAKMASREENAEMDDFTEGQTKSDRGTSEPVTESRDSTKEADDEEKGEEDDEAATDESEDDDTGNVDDYMIKFIEEGYYGDI